MEMEFHQPEFKAPLRVGVRTRNRFPEGDQNIGWSARLGDHSQRTHLPLKKVKKGGPGVGYLCENENGKIL